MLKISAPAKLNLFFEVLGLRADGYHDVSSLTVPVSLYDHLSFELLDESPVDISLKITSGNTREFITSIPNDERNLVVKAVRQFSESVGFFRPLAITLEKNIPSEAGLGGGSSDAAAALFAVNQLWKTNLSKKELQKIGADIGSDVPLFFESSYAYGTGRGEITEPLVGLPPLKFLLFKPSFGLSTPKVYAATPETSPADRRRPDQIIDAIRRNDIVSVRSLFFNRLEDAARRISPDLDQIMTRLSRIVPFSMTGSGTALFSLYQDTDDIEHSVSEIINTHIQGDLFFCSTLPSFGETKNPCSFYSERF